MPRTSPPAVLRATAALRDVHGAPVVVFADVATNRGGSMLADEKRALNGVLELLELFGVEDDARIRLQTIFGGTQ